MELRNYYRDSKGKMVYIPWEVKCDMMTMRCRVLEDCTGVPNMDRIWPLKQRIVRDLYNKVKDIPNLVEFWIFGSSTQMRCNIYSDLDIAYLTSDDNDIAVRDACSGCDPTGYDVININRLGEHEPLLGQIRKGARLV